MPHVVRIPALALALAALATPALAQVEPPVLEGEETDPAGPAVIEVEVEADQPPRAATALDVGLRSQGGTGALVAGDGTQLGNVSVSANASGHALVIVNAEGFREGVYATHLHQVGACEGPGFESAGDHIGGSHAHGVMTPTGPHPGDLPNAYVGPDQQLAFEAFAVGLTLGMVFDADGSALIVHERPDDYLSQPGGESGARIACAVIELAPGTLLDDTVDVEETLIGD